VLAGVARHPRAMSGPNARILPHRRTRGRSRDRLRLTALVVSAGWQALALAAGSCPLDVPNPIAPRFSTDLDIPAGATEVRADDVELVEQGASTFEGDVDVVRDDFQLKADRVVWNEADDRATFRGDAVLWNEALVWQGERGLIDLANDQVTLEQGRYALEDGSARGDATVLERDDRENFTRLVGVDYSTCQGPRRAWRLSASSIELDHDEDSGTAKHVVLRANEIPVFYFPYMSFPLSNARKSGLLVPTVRSSSESGFDLRVPIYWNIAPNYDATITPRTITDRGGALGAQFRYKFQTGEGLVEGEVLPEDELYSNRTRSLFVFKHFQRFDSQRGWIRADINQVSDENYFEDLGTSLGVTSARFLNRDLEAFYRGQRWSLRGLIRNFQTIDPSLPGAARPYRVLPRITFAGNYSRGYNRLAASLVAQATYFERRDTVTGGRMVVEPRLYVPFRDAGRYFIPSLKLRAAQYFLDNNDFSEDDSPTRIAPVLSLDSGLIAERRFEAFGESLLQTLEPRVYYLYIPEVDQSDIPVFDSGEFDFTFQNLFRDNRFSGGDRVGDTNQLAVAVTSRVLNRETGAERLRFSLGQVYYFTDREIALPGRESQDATVSEFLGEAAVQLASGWRARTTVQWDPEDSRTEKLAFVLNYRPDNGTVVNLGYRRRLAITDVEQTDVSFQYPITERWSVLGRWNYSLESDQTLELVGGVEYDSCCWGLRVGGRRFIRNVRGDFDTAFFVQIHLKGLAGLGSVGESFLRNQIPGYYTRF